MIKNRAYIYPVCDELSIYTDSNTEMVEIKSNGHDMDVIEYTLPFSCRYSPKNISNVRHFDIYKW